ncbi:Uncharacterized protein M6B38_227710 [Iris pallida]|uniref:Uncharacterized protein n=1 Tax=Iris pallida TaxID=29817 RepID=A0AAX6DTU4_IRIPA|nr:Uncharacterized protein M6B38_227710 [Iris pallida]
MSPSLSHLTIHGTQIVAWGSRGTRPNSICSQVARQEHLIVESRKCQVCLDLHLFRSREQGHT